jgi:hypothetical protein
VKFRQLKLGHRWTRRNEMESSIHHEQPYFHSGPEFYMTFPRREDFWVNRALQDEQRLLFYNLREGYPQIADMLQSFVVTQRRTKNSTCFFSFLGWTRLELGTSVISGHRLDYPLDQSTRSWMVLAMLMLVSVLCWTRAPTTRENDKKRWKCNRYGTRRVGWQILFGFRRNQHKVSVIKGVF